MTELVYHKANCTFSDSASANLTCTYQFAPMVFTEMGPSCVLDLELAQLFFSHNGKGTMGCDPLYASAVQPRRRSATVGFLLWALLAFISTCFAAMPLGTTNIRKVDYNTAALVLDAKYTHPPSLFANKTVPIHGTFSPDQVNAFLDITGAVLISEPSLVARACVPLYSYTAKATRTISFLGTWAQVSDGAFLPHRNMPCHQRAIEGKSQRNLLGILVSDWRTK